MAEFTGRIVNMFISYATGKPLLTLECDEHPQRLEEMITELRAADSLSVKLSKHKKKRSLDANAYCFVLIGKIAEKTNVPKEEVYRAAIKDIGGNYDVVCVQDKAVETLCDTWKKNGLGWQTDTMPSKIEGCTNVILYYGSSTYDTKTMSRLIDNIVQDCKALGIETMTPAELSRLKESWYG
jgi:hypothetical protein